MSLEWDILTPKEQTMLRLADNNDTTVDLNHIQDTFVTDKEEKSKDRLKKMKNNGFLKKKAHGKYTVVSEKIPAPQT